MYHRISKKTFDRYIQRLNQEHRLTKNQVQWEYERYLLNNRLAAAEKRGYVFSEDVLPQRPTRVTAKSLDALKKVKGDVALFDLADFVKVEKLSNKAIDKIIKAYGEKGEAAFGELTSGEPVIGKPEKLKTEEPSPLPVEPKEALPDIPEDVIDDTGWEEPYDPKDFYPEDDIWEPTEPIDDIDYTILENILEQIGAAEYENDSDAKLFGENKRIKENAVSLAGKLIRDAISELGKRTVAERLQNAAVDANELVTAILHYYYIGKSELTQERTSSRLHVLSEILYANDTARSMADDFLEEEGFE